MRVRVRVGVKVGVSVRVRVRVRIGARVGGWGYPNLFGADEDEELLGARYARVEQVAVEHAPVLRQHLAGVITR